ncbi:hypothetical protein HO173_010155 [Letharia columbiana]|uniref:Uncharacterized protein n=1 Tax=Letharia columbiana TaxID=112416 RepID=A0A8H6FN60_9LECA|nr:uncharacterized protein HO173_010155 [Letharia columbiana]KAF6231623.1 hypothetical protein HO173_010155 [Letharia columbiana]
MVLGTRGCGKRSDDSLPALLCTKNIPERLLIYHAGTPRIVFVGFLKITTIFLFTASVLLVAPTFYHDPKQPAWVAPAVAAAGAVPLLYVTYYAAPFVAFVHIKLPIFARRSTEHLLNWARNIPSKTEVDLTTIKSYGSLRISRMQISELRPTKARFGIENLIRVPHFSSIKKRPWWAPKERNLFFVGSERRKTVETAVWQKALGQIRNTREKSNEEAHNRK